MATVIEFAEKKLEEEQEDYLVKYWAAYRDGAKAQLKECKQFKAKTDDIMATVECKTIAFIKSVSVFAKDMDELFTEYLKVQAEVDTLFKERKPNAEV